MAAVGGTGEAVPGVRGATETPEDKEISKIMEALEGHTVPVGLLKPALDSVPLMMMDLNMDNVSVIVERTVRNKRC